MALNRLGRAPLTKPVSSDASRDAKPSTVDAKAPTNAPVALDATVAKRFETFTAGQRSAGSQPPRYADELRMNDDELRAAISASIGIRSHTAELPSVEEVRQLYAQGKQVVFSKLALEEARNLPDLKDEFAKRERIQGVTLSIDHYETTDLDNAISYRKGDDGSHFVSVTGTDVAAHVRLGGALDFAARRRTATQYSSDDGLVLPMLPLFLSEGKLSLFEGEERLGKTVELHYSPEGQLIGTRIYNSVVKNTHLSDDDAAEAREGLGRGAKDPALAQALKALTELGAKIGGSPSGAISIGEMTPRFTGTAASELGKALKAAGLETSYRNQESGQKSIYDDVPTGHDGVNAEAYATFTGPMRRYADLDVQRAVDRMLAGKRPDGRLADLDKRQRDVQLDRLNKVTHDPRLKVRKELSEVTRKPAHEVVAPPEEPTTPPLAPNNE